VIIAAIEKFVLRYGKRGVVVSRSPLGSQAVVSFEADGRQDLELGSIFAPSTKDELMWRRARTILELKYSTSFIELHMFPACKRGRVTFTRFAKRER
jgi:hypothetical protein